RASPETSSRPAAQSHSCGSPRNQGCASGVELVSTLQQIVALSRAHLRVAPFSERVRRGPGSGKDTGGIAPSWRRRGKVPHSTPHGSAPWTLAAPGAAKVQRIATQPGVLEVGRAGRGEVPTHRRTALRPRKLAAPGRAKVRTQEADERDTRELERRQPGRVRPRQCTGGTGAEFSRAAARCAGPQPVQRRAGPSRTRGPPRT